MPYTLASQVSLIAIPVIECDNNGNPMSGTQYAIVPASTTDTIVKASAGTYYGCKVSAVAALAVNINDGSSTFDIIPASLGLGVLSNIPSGGILFNTSLVVKG